MNLIVQSCKNKIDPYNNPMDNFYLYFTHENAESAVKLFSRIITCVAHFQQSCFYVI